MGSGVMRSQLGKFFLLNDNNAINKVEQHYSKNGKLYGFCKGVAKFGSGSNAIYQHYDIDNNDGNYIMVGSENIQNTIKVSSYINGSLYCVKSDSNVVFYMIQTGYDVHEDDGYIIFGKRQDGSFVKYLDTDDIKKNYFGERSSIAWGNINFQGNTIKIVYEKHISGYNYTKIGEFRFKWDNNAQWFSIEQVVYYSKFKN